MSNKQSILKALSLFDCTDLLQEEIKEALLSLSDEKYSDTASNICRLYDTIRQIDIQRSMNGKKLHFQS
jgi:hypothetical protein